MGNNFLQSDRFDADGMRIGVAIGLLGRVGIIAHVRADIVGI